MAFVAPTLAAARPAAVSARASAFTTTARPAVVAAPAARHSSTVVMVNDNKRRFNRVEKAAAAKAAAAESGTFGWVPKAEMLNGRAAMFGFLLGLSTELISGHSIYVQVKVLQALPSILSPF